MKMARVYLAGKSAVRGLPIAIGAGVGNPVAGAVVGGLGGAAIGAATTPRRYYYW